MRLSLSFLALVALVGFAAAAPVDSAGLVARGLPNGNQGPDYKRTCPDGQPGCGEGP
ncbi:hypothetical protein BD414DRAFT_479505 [Trametes punicea]|nr:hypothetical protein BD414DRAFT_479505 [Trametes punicea]